MTAKPPFSYSEAGMEPGITPIPVSLRQQLQVRIDSISYGAFCLLVRHALYRCGYSSVHSVGRIYRQEALPRGKGNKVDPKNGGLDLMALSHTDIATSLTLVQVKQYRDVVPRRFVYELIGAMALHGAERGLLVTSSRFAPLAREAATASRAFPINLIDGPLLVEILYARRIGIIAIQKPGGEKGQVAWALDAAFFNSLEEQVRRMAEDEHGADRETKGGA